MRMLACIVGLLFAGLLSAHAQTALPPPNVRGLNGLDTVTWSTTGSLAYGVWPVTIGRNGVLFATATSQLNCATGGDATIKIIAGTGTNPATGATLQATIAGNSLSVWAFAGGQGNGTRWLIQPGQTLTDLNSGSVVHKNVVINAETFTGGYTNIFLNANNTDPQPTVGDVINLIFNNPGLSGNPITIPYTVTSGDIGADANATYSNLTIHITSAINANATLSAAKIGAWSSPPPSVIQIAQLAGTPSSTTLSSSTTGSHTETIGFGISQPGTIGSGPLDTNPGGAGIYSLTGTQPDVTGAYPYFEMFTVAPVPGSGLVSLSPEITMTNCQPFNITTYSGIATGLISGATYWLNVSIRSISGSSVGYTNNYFHYVTY